MRVLVVMDPIDRINPEADTTLVLVEELHRRKHEVEQGLSAPIPWEVARAAGENLLH